MWNRVLSEERAENCRNLRAQSDCCRNRREESERNNNRRRCNNDLEEALENIVDSLDNIEECVCERIPRLLMRILAAIEEDKRHRC